MTTEDLIDLARAIIEDDLAEYSAEEITRLVEALTERGCAFDAEQLDNAATEAGIYDTEKN